MGSTWLQTEDWRAKLLQENILFLFMRIIRVIKRKMISTLGGLPLLPGRLMISVLPGFSIRVDMLNEPVKPLRKFLQVPFKIRIPVLWLPVTPAPLAARAMRKVIFIIMGR